MLQNQRCLDTYTEPYKHCYIAMDKSLIDRIKDDINKTGFVTELKVASACHSNGWHVSHSSSYEDYDQSKSREIDIVATSNYKDEEANLYTEFHLVIEVKSISKNPWVVFTTPHYFKGMGWRILHSGWNYTTKKWALLKGDHISEYCPFVAKDRIGKAFHEAFKKPNENSKIFESILSACKASFYLKDNHGIEPFKEEFNPEKSVEIHFYIPMIVLDGILFEAYLDEGDIVVSEQDWIPVEYSYSARSYRVDSSETTFFPAIVCFNHVNSFLKQLNEWVKHCNEGFSSELVNIKSK